jgi:hypothetical protein
LVSSPEKSHDDDDGGGGDYGDASNKVHVLQSKQNSAWPYTCMVNSVTRDLIEFDC